MKTMEWSVAVPYEAQESGMSWDWEIFPEFLFYMHILKLMVIFLFFVHWAACSWGALSFRSFEAFFLGLKTILHEI